MNRATNPTTEGAPDGGAHLTEDQVDEVLLDFAGPDALAHLAVCALCRDRVRSFADSMALFNKTTLRWAEAKSSTMPVPRPGRRRFGWNWAVASPVAASLAMGAALLVFSHYEAASHTQRAVQVAANEAPAAPDLSQLAQTPLAQAQLDRSQLDRSQLDRDNAMLRAISLEMQPVESPLSSYGAGAGHNRGRADRGTSH